LGVPLLSEGTLCAAVAQNLRGERRAGRCGWIESLDALFSAPSCSSRVGPRFFEDFADFWEQIQKSGV
jgi:hypothetical protein